MWTNAQRGKPAPSRGDLALLELLGSAAAELVVGAASTLQGAAGLRDAPPTGRARSGPASDVLVVEDDAFIREQLADLLRTEGFEVATARDGREALALVRRQPVGVVILDLMMPVMSGWEFIREIRADAEQADLPILVITAASNVHRAESGPVFLKPLNVDSLLRAVRARVAQFRA